MTSSTASAADSSSKKAISAQLSSTLEAISQVPFALAFLHQGLHDALAFQGAAKTADVFAGDGTQNDAVRRGGDCSLGAILDAELPAEGRGNDDLAFGGEGDGIGKHVY